MWRKSILVLFIGFARLVSSASSSASPSDSRTHSIYNINYQHINRQIDAPPVTIPLPTAPTNINAPPGAPPTHPPPSPTSGPSKTDPPQSPLGMFPGSTKSPPGPSIPISASSVPSSALTTLPPRPSHTTSSTPHHFKFIYLIPVFATLGLMWGILAAWLAFGWATRHPRVRDPNGLLAIGGPRYVPPSDMGDHDETDGHQYRSLFYRAAEEGRSEGEVMRELQMFKWPSVHFGAGRAREREREGDDDPFLDPPVASLVVSRDGTPSKQRRNKLTRPKRRPAIRKRSTGAAPVDDAISTTAFLRALGSEEEDEEEEEHKVPWESLRHKSIKRGILEQVKKENSWIDSLRGFASASFRYQMAADDDGAQPSGADKVGTVVPSDTGNPNVLGKRIGRRHERTDSDLYIEDLNLQRQRNAAQMDRHDHPSLSMSRPIKLRTETDQTAGSTGSFSRSGVRFQIVDESPLPTPGVECQGLEGEVLDTSPSAWWGEEEEKGPDARVEVDRYTPMPVKLSTSRTHSCNNSRSASPIKGTPVRERGFSFGTGNVNHAAVLPQSPPVITSPRLESHLFFTPTPPAKAKAKMSVSYYPRSSLAEPEPEPTPTSMENEGKRNTHSVDESLVAPVSRHDPVRSVMGVNSPRPDVKVRPRQVRSPIAAAAAAKRKVQAQAQGKARPVTLPSIHKALSAAGSEGEASPAPGSDTEEVVQSGDEIDAHMASVMRRLDEIIEGGWGARETREVA